MEACLEMDRIQEHAAAVEDESDSTPTHQVEKVEEHIPSLTSFPSTEILKDECSEDKKREISENIEEKTNETQKLVDEGSENASSADRSARVEACLVEGFQEHEAAEEDESAPTTTHPAENVEQNPSPSSLPSAEITKEDGTEDPSEDKTEESTFLQKEMPSDHFVALERETHELDSPLGASAVEKDVTAKQSSGKDTLPETEAVTENKSVVPRTLQLEIEGEHIGSLSLASLPTEVMKNNGAKDLEELKSEEQACLQMEGLADPIAACGNEIHNNMIPSADEKEQESEATITVNQIEENAKQSESLTKDTPEHASEADTSSDNRATSQNQQVQELGATRKDETVAAEDIHGEKVEENGTLPTSAFPSNDQKQDNRIEDEINSMRMQTKYSPASETEETTCREHEAAKEYQTAAADDSVRSEVLPVVELLEKELLLTIENTVGTKEEEAEKLDEGRNRSFLIEKKIPEVPLQEDKDDITTAQTCSDDELENKLQIAPSESTREEMVPDKITVSKDVEEEKAEERQVAETMKTETSNERSTELEEAKIAFIQASTQPESEEQVQTPTLALPSNEQDLRSRTAVEKVDKETKEVEFLEDKNQEPSATAIETTEAIQQNEVLHKLEAVKKDETSTSATEEQRELPSVVIPLQSGEKVHQTMISVGAMEDMQEKDEVEKPKIKFGEQTIAPIVKSQACPSKLECDSGVQIPEEEHVAAETDSSFEGKHRKETSEGNEIAENNISNVEVREDFETSSPISGPEGEMKEIYQKKFETSKTETEVSVGTESTRESNNADLKIADNNKSIDIPEKDSVALEKIKEDENEDSTSEVPQNKESKGIAGGYEKIQHQPGDASDVAFDRQNPEAVQPTEITVTVIPAASEPLPLEKQNVLEETIKEAELTGTGSAADSSSGGIKPGVEGEDKLQNSKEETIVSTLLGPSLSDLLQRSTKEKLELGEHVESRESKEAESIRVKGEKIEEEKDEEREGDAQQQADSGSDSLVIVDVVNKDAKVSPKKSHNILSGVGSKVKHSISKVKKAISGKSSHAKPASPKREKL